MEQQTNRKRGDRLHPSRGSRTYAVLTLMREEMRKIATDCLPKGSRGLALDFGCGNMPYRPFFEAAGFQYLGIDVKDNPDADLVLSPQGYVDYPNGICDVIISTQVLEHVCGPVGYLQECHRLLRPGGRLILSTHGYWNYHPDPVDYWRWTAEGLQKVVEDAGFAIKRFRGVIGLAGVSFQLFQDATICKIPVWLQPSYARVIQAAILMLNRLSTAAALERDAMVYMLVAEKVELKT